MTEAHDGAERETWARVAARDIIDGVLAASEHSVKPLPQATPDQVALLREIAKHALWHMPRPADEARNLLRYILENMRQPHLPSDDEAPWA
jgi:hypothetical protein